MIFLLELAKEVESVSIAARDTSYGLIARVSSNRLKVPRLLMYVLFQLCFGFTSYPEVTGS